MVCLGFFFFFGRRGDGEGGKGYLVEGIAFWRRGSGAVGMGVVLGAWDEGGKVVGVGAWEMGRVGLGARRAEEEEEGWEAFEGHLFFFFSLGDGEYKVSGYGRGVRAWELMAKMRFGSVPSQGEDRRLAVLSSFEASDLTFSRWWANWNL